MLVMTLAPGLALALVLVENMLVVVDTPVVAGNTLEKMGNSSGLTGNTMDY